MVSSRSAGALRGLAVAAVMALVPVVAGCEAGTNSPTQQWHQPTPGASAAVNGVTINNVFVLGAPPQSWLSAGQSAGLFLALTNTGPGADRLIGVSAPGTASTVALPRGGVAISSQHQVLLQGPAPVIVLQRLTRSLRGGQFIPLTLHFQQAGSITLHVPVQPRAAAYATFSPAPASPTPTPTPSGVGRTRQIGPTPTPTSTG